MILKHLIARLEVASPEYVVPLGFNNPHSYRGYYDDLAFEPAEFITVSEMLAAARFALGNTFTAYKGGEYKMSERTEIWLAYEGDTGEGIGNVLLDYMLGQIETEKV